MASNFTLPQNFPLSTDLLLPTVLYTLPALYLCYSNSRKMCLLRNGWIRRRCIAILCYLVKVIDFQIIAEVQLLNPVQLFLQIIHFLVNICNLLFIWMIFVMMLNKVFLYPNITYPVGTNDFELDKQIFYFIRSVFLYTVALVPSIIIYEWKFRHSRLQLTR